jgi:hypothetical protein
MGGTLSQQDDFVINESQNANALPPKRLQFSLETICMNCI